MIILIWVVSSAIFSIISSKVDTKLSVVTRSFKSTASTDSLSSSTEKVSALLATRKKSEIDLRQPPGNQQLRRLNSGGASHSDRMIANEGWASALFGERGLLSGIFQILDQQRKSTQFLQNDGSPRINSNSLDFKKIFDALLMGANSGNFEDPLPELPEFLGLCNKLSCGDIYKAIDMFRRSELFSNFQTALSLIHDPNGWETIGNLLSNPELISQFTAGTEMGEFLGSALGQAKKHSDKAKEKNAKLTPEDGDFGTEFTDGEESLPKVDFSIDEKGEKDYEDYYEEVNIETQTTETTNSTPTTTSGTLKTRSLFGKEVALPEISFSIDVDEDSEKENKLTERNALVPSSTKNKGDRTIATWIATTAKPPYHTFSQFTVTLRQTTRNHRKDSDYYAMYYND